MPWLLFNLYFLFLYKINCKKSVEKEDDIIIRIPRKLYSKEVQRLINIIQFKKTVGHSKATQKDIDDIMNNIKKE